MADNKKYKVGITAKEPWAADISYESLDYTLWRVQAGGDGCGYIALKANIGVRPDSDRTVWIPAVERGQSIYDLAVKYHHFDGTEEEFEAQYQAALAAANNAAAAASATDAQVQAAEAARVSAEQARATAEAGRVAAESGRVAAENDRVSAEAARVSAESARDTAESTRATAETARQSAETARDTAEAARASAELSRAQRFGELETDLENSIELSDQAATAAIRAAETVDGFVEAEAARVEAEQGRVSAENGRVTAEQGRVSAESARATAETARATAESGRASAETARATAEAERATAEEGRASAETARETQASGDHTRAEEDHTAAASDHTLAASDHTKAESDTSRAGTDHATAASDHTTAASDHTQAGTDHSRAETDHTTAASDHTAAVADHTQAASDHTTALSDHSVAESDHSRAEEDHTRAEADHESIANKANIDGSYDTMSVGMAKNLEGKSIVTESFLERTSGGDAEIANGPGALQGVEGNSQVWNQLLAAINAENYTAVGKVTISDGALVYTGTGSDYYAQVNLANSKRFDVVAGHKYLLSFDVPVNTITSNIYEYFGFGTAINRMLGYVRLGGTTGHKSDIITVNTSATVLCVGFASLTATPIANGETASVKNLQLIDLTLLGIDNLTTVEAVEAWLAENIGEQAYYSYNPGTILNANLEGIESSGFNLLDPATGKAELIGTYSDVYDSYYGITGTHGAITFTDRYGNTETVTPDEGGKFLLEKAGTLTVASAGEDCAVFLWWDGTRTEFEPYEMNVGNLDVKHIYGKLNGEGDYVQVWPTGMPGIGDIKDTLKIENGEVVARRNVGEVDLGGLNWNYRAGGFSVSLPDMKKSRMNYYCQRYASYSPIASGSGFDGLPDLSITENNGSGNWTIGAILIKDSAYTDAATFKAAMAGVPLYYELATPQVYTDLIYQGSSLFADGTPVTLPVNYKVNNWGIERVLPKNTSEVTATAKPTLTCRYSIDAVEQLDTMQTEIENLDEKKPNKFGDYPDMAVGSARALAGNNKQLEDFVFTDINAANGIAKLDSVRGKSLVWNQQFTKNAFPSGTSAGVTYIANGDGSYTATGTATSTNGINTQQSVLGGHKYLLLCFSNDSHFIANVYDPTIIGPAGINAPTIFTAQQSGILRNCRIVVVNGSTVNEAKAIPIFIDLTLMFGAGNEPTTVEEFEELFPMPYYDYNEGEIISNKTESVKLVGFNQWDEEWEAGTIDTTTGANSSSTTRGRSVNYIRVLGNANYYITVPATMYYYDGAKNYIGYRQRTSAGVFTVPEDCVYLRISPPRAGYGATYKNDICINISDANRNGEYEPYKTNTISLNLPALTGKLNGEGESVVVFPEGMKKVGSTYDEAQGSTAIKKIGKRAYQSGDESDTSVVTDGTNTLYALATPETYTLDTPLPETFQAYKGGTMMQLPQNGSAPTTAPMVMEWTGALDAVSILTGLPQNYVSKESLQAMLGAMQSAGLFASYTMTFDETNNRYSFTFTPNPTE